MKLYQFLARLKAEAALRTSLVAKHLADGSLRDTDVLGDCSLSPVSIKQVADQ
ncbi:hypothetical protein KTE50_28400 [Burkholderia multivorans]|uniref:hypothetical protein n=1 Tax=Burkholderia multivorans TaxID=87883 RepID=UPI001C26FFC2|nr:hypothetical protein [Burkholderia multivorans]MBU9552461.1 hypothetical protein [Burkholderia multivorans]